VKEIVGIAKQYEGKRGVIHTVSFALTERLAEALHDAGIGKRIVTHSRTVDRGDCIRDYISSPGSVLLSPSVTEGFDFVDEQCEFIIFVKVPYPSYGDAWVKTRAQSDWDWYAWTAARNIVQGAGRGVRHETDKCDTWILDGGVRRLQSFFPKWFNVINL
jgi:Rad3-related DNA helicase